MKQIRKIILILAMGVHAAAIGVAQEMTLPVEDQVPLLMKILTYDRSLTKGGNLKIVIGVLYQSSVRSSLTVKEEFLARIKQSDIVRILGQQPECHALEYVSESQVLEEMRKFRINVLYVAPLRAVPLQGIRKITIELNVLSITGIPSYVEAGLSIGIGSKGEKPQIIVNLPSAKQEGADISSQLLRIAKVLE
ncbi:MAG: YfiR family protein [bacterium]